MRKSLKQAVLGVVLGGMGLVSVQAGGTKGEEVAANVFSIEQKASDRYELQIRLPDYTLATNAASALEVRCSVPGAVRHDPSAPGTSLPEFVRVISQDRGHAAQILDLSIKSRVVPVGSEIRTFAEKSGASPVSASTAWMGQRGFLRISVRPFQPDPAGEGIRVLERIDATIRLLDREEAKALRPVGEALQSATDSGPCAVCPPPMPLGVSAGGGQPGDFQARRSVTNDLAWKIAVTNRGLVRLTGTALESAGVPAAIRDSTRLRLAARDSEIPFWTSTSGPLGDTDWIAFYAARETSPDTDENIYWLAAGDPSTPPARDGAPLPGAPVRTATWTRVEYAPDRFYSASYKPLEDGFDHWFAMSIYGGTASNIVLATPNPVSTGEVYLGYSVHGRNDYGPVNPDHQTRISVNGTLLVDRTYDGEQWLTGTGTAAGVVGSGMSTVVLSQPIPTGVPVADFSIAWLEHLHLCYQRILVGNDLPLFFRGTETGVTMRITGVTATNLLVLDVSDPLEPVSVTNFSVLPAGAADTLEVGDPVASNRCFGLFDLDAAAPPESISLVRFRTLADPGRQADYLALAPSDFRDPVYRLLKHRYRNALSVLVATPDDVYNEFGYGVEDARAIRQFFGYAFHHYASPAPGYALLAGNGSYDPLDRLGTGDPQFIPTRMGPAPFRRTSLEQWFVTVNGTNLPDMALGRIPAETQAEMEHAVEKILSFETQSTNGAWYQDTLLVADDDSGTNFMAFTENNTKQHLINGGFDSLFDIQTAYLDSLTQPQVTTIINSFLDSGGHYLHYMGHGSVARWAQENIWNDTDAASATNTLYPVFAVFTCQSGAFHEPGESCLAEVIVEHEAAGSACVAPTALSVQLYAEELADGFYEALAEDRVPRLGDALQAGFLRLWTLNNNAAELSFYTIFGDPAQALWGGATP